MKTNDKTKNALSGLEWAINQTIVKAKADDEFTVQDYYDLAGGMMMQMCRRKLADMRDQGLLIARNGVDNGRACIFYRKA